MSESGYLDVSQHADEQEEDNETHRAANDEAQASREHKHSCLSDLHLVQGSNLSQETF